MRRLACVLILMAGTANAQAVAKPRTPDPVTLWTWSRNLALAAATDLGGYKASRPLTVVEVSGKVSVIGGGGAGTTVINISDGTNSCTATFACTDTASLGVKQAAMVAGVGTGCSFAPGALLSAAVSSAGCTTTQPTFINLNVVAKFR